MVANHRKMMIETLKFMNDVVPQLLHNLVQKTPVTMVYKGDISIVHGVYEQTYNWGGTIL